MQFYPILGKKCNLWKLRKRFFAHKESNKGQVKGGIQMAKRGENIHKRKDGRWEGRYIKGRTAEGKPVWGYLYGYAYSEVREELIKQKALSGFYQLSGKSMHFQNWQRFGLRLSGRVSKNPHMFIISTLCTNIFFLF